MKNLSNENLLMEIKRSVAAERVAISEVLQYLAEVEDRKLHLARGYASLWDFVTKYLGYSEGEAYRRIQSMRLLREEPQAKQDLEEGRISLTVAADGSDGVRGARFSQFTGGPGPGFPGFDGARGVAGPDRLPAWA